MKYGALGPSINVWGGPRRPDRMNIKKDHLSSIQNNDFRFGLATFGGPEEARSRRPGPSGPLRKDCSDLKRKSSVCRKKI